MHDPRTHRRFPRWRARPATTLILVLALAGFALGLLDSGWAIAGSPELDQAFAKAQELHRNLQSQKALPLATKALELAEEEYADDSDGELAEVLVLYANVLRDLARWEEAEAHYQRAIAIYENGDGPEGLGLSKALKELATLNWVRSELDTAKARLTRAARIIERDETVEGLENLGEVLEKLAKMSRASQQPDEAERYLLRAIAVWEQAMSVGMPEWPTDAPVPKPKHPNTLMALMDLMEIYAEQGREDEQLIALLIADESLEIRWATVGGKLDIAASLTELSAATTKSAPVEAERYALKAVALREEASGDEDPTLVEPLVQLARAIAAQGRCDEAEPVVVRGLAIAERHGVPDTVLGAGLRLLAQIYDGQGKHTAAAELQDRMLRSGELCSARKRLVLAAAYLEIGEQRRLLGFNEEAERALLGGLAVLEESRDDIDPTVALMFYGALLKSLADVSDAGNKADRAAMFKDRLNHLLEAQPEAEEALTLMHETSMEQLRRSCAFASHPASG